MKVFDVTFHCETQQDIARQISCSSLCFGETYCVAIIEKSLTNAKQLSKMKTKHRNGIGMTISVFECIIVVETPGGKFHSK